MLRFAIVLSLFFSWTSSFGQHFTKCKIYQFPGTDSLSQKLVSEEIYNDKGRITSYYYKGYKESSSVSNTDVKNFDFYRDTLLILSTSIDENGDSGKTIYSYNASGQLIKEEFFRYEKRLRSDVDKGYGRPGGCIVTAADYEKERTWKQTSEINFSYDSRGNKILYDATKLHFTSQNKYTWTYDDSNRVVTYNSYDGDRLIWTEHYSYYQGGYKFTRTWYNADGSETQFNKESWDYWPQYTFTYQLNARGQITEERVTNEKGEAISSETKSYNANGKIARTTKFDSKGKPEITHIYVYE